MRPPFPTTPPGARRSASGASPKGERRKYFSALGTRRYLVLALALLSLACEDRISGPEAVELVRALEAPFTPAEGEQRIADSLLMQAISGWQQNWFASRHVAVVEVDWGGRPAEYRAMVFERLMTPPHGFIPDGGCAGPRWWLILRPVDGRSEGLVLMGGDFAQPIQQELAWCPEASMPSPQPILWAGRMVPDESGQLRRHQIWKAAAGAASISPGLVAAECQSFLELEAVTSLREDHGITCLLTRHQVSFRAHLPQPLGDGRGEGLVTVELRPTEVLGTRYTIHCNPAAVELGHNCLRP